MKTKKFFQYAFLSILLFLIPSFLFSQNDISNSEENVCLSSNGGRAVAISQGEYNGITEYSYNANDGNPRTFWASEWSMPAWLEIKFNHPHDINEIGVWWGSHQQKFQISLSMDGNSWTTVVSPRLSNNYEGSSPVHELFRIRDTRARFIRIDILGTSAPRSHIFQAIVNDLEAFARPNYHSNNLSSNKMNFCLSSNGGRATAISQGEYNGNTEYAYNANDGDPKTFWASEWSMPAWLEIEFNYPHDINKVGVWWGSHQQKFQISLSMDGNSWVTVVPSRISNNSEGSSPVHESFRIQETRAKYIRIDILATSAPRSHIFQAIVNELEAFGR